MAISCPLVLSHTTTTIMFTLENSRFLFETRAPFSYTGEGVMVCWLDCYGDAITRHDKNPAHFLYSQQQSVDISQLKCRIASIF